MNPVYRTRDPRIGGVVIPFVDATAQQRLQAALEQALQAAQSPEDTPAGNLAKVHSLLRAVSQPHPVRPQRKGCAREPGCGPPTGSIEFISTF